MLVIVLTQIIPSLLFLELLLPYVRLIPHLRSSPIKNRTWYNWGTNNVVCLTRILVTYLDHRMILLNQKRRGASNFHLHYSKIYECPYLPLIRKKAFHTKMQLKLRKCSVLICYHLIIEIKYCQEFSEPRYVLNLFRILNAIISSYHSLPIVIILYQFYLDIMSKNARFNERVCLYFIIISVLHGSLK